MTEELLLNASVRACTRLFMSLSVCACTFLHAVSAAGSYYHCKPGACAQYSQVCVRACVHVYVNLELVHNIVVEKKSERVCKVREKKGAA